MKKSLFGNLSAIIGLLTLSIGVILKTFLPQIIEAYYRANVKGDFSSDMYDFNILPIILIGVAEVVLGLVISFWIKDTK